ncbi:MAG: hypothetical protein LBO78_00075 [Rickettsiales bacterium]|nr:hypothetical protein [Rickettsiales bacterium]
MDIFRSVYCFLAGTITYYKNNFLREQFHRKKQQPALKSLSRKMNADPNSDYSFHHMVPLHLSRYVKDPNANSLITGLPNYHHVYTHDDIIADQLEGLNMSHEYPVLILAPRYKPLYMYSIDGAEDAIHRYQKQEAAALEKIYDFNNRQKSA